MYPLEIGHRSTVTPDQIDELVQMNVRYYGVNVGAATRLMCERLGLLSVLLHSADTRHRVKQMEGKDLVVRSAVLPGGERLRTYHEFVNDAGADLAATFVHELD